MNLNNFQSRINLEEIFENLGLDKLSQENKKGSPQTEHLNLKELNNVYAQSFHNPKNLTDKSLIINENKNLLVTDSLTLRRLAEIRHCLNCNHEISQDIETQVEEKRGTTTITLVCNNCNTTNKWSFDNEMIRIDEPRAKSYLPNFVILSFVVSGQYFKDYANCLGGIGLGSLSEKQWSRIIDWVEPHVKAIADWSIGEARAEIISRGDE